MTDADKARAERRVRGVFDTWVKNLGLGNWTFSVIHRDRGPSDDAPGGPFRTAATTCAQWEYLNAEINVNLEAVHDMTMYQLECLLVHELLHVLFSELSDRRFKHRERKRHEERVATELAMRLLEFRDQCVAWGKRHGKKKAPRRRRSRRTRG